MNAMEGLLNKSKVKYRELVENSNSIILRLDRYGNVTFINEFAREFFRYSGDEIVGRNVLGTIVPMSDSAGRDLQEMMGDLLRQPEEYRTNVNENIRKNGECVWISWTNKAIYDDEGNVAGLLCVGNDITRLKQAEDALKLTQYSIDRAADEILWITPEGKIIYANDAACDALQYARDGLQGLNVWEFDPIYTRDTWEEHWQEIKKRGRFTIETLHRAKDGRTFPVEVSVNYVKVGDREFNFAYIKDITERKKVENELKEAKAQVELYLDLVGHDINNLNQVALGYLEMAEDVIKSGGRVDEHNRELIEKPVISLNNSSKLIDNVRKLQKIMAGQKMVEICPRDILEEACRQFSGISDVDIKLYPPEACEAKVMADELLIDVFTNIIGNAIKHSSGGKNLRIVVRSMPFFENEKRYCKITIEDNGPGISEDKKCQIFKRSLRGNTQAKGSGLGLYIVNSLVESYGGKVWVEDRVRGDHTMGSRFVVMLPSTG